MKKLSFLFCVLIIISSIQFLGAQQFYNFNPDTVKAQKFDMGKMWTFENPPLDYFEKEYNFKPSNEWLEKVRKSSLKFGTGCSASFISADGLLITNHHCVRSILPDLNKEGENLLNNGFYAKTMEDERPVPNLHVDQLMVIKDVTNEVLNAMQEGENDSVKIALRDQTIENLKAKLLEEHPDLYFKTISLYQGGKYSLYGYKRYNDVRLVFVPELWVAKLGGDYDNFTYPRYGLDCAFLRAYNDDGNPVKTDYYFTWSNNNVKEDQPVFVIGNPGSTDRIYTTAQIKYERDIHYPMLTKMFKDLYAVYYSFVKENEVPDTRLVARLYSIGNRLKVYEGTYKALLDPYLMARKKDFENNFKSKVHSDKILNKKYGNIWSELEKSRTEATKHAKKIFAYTISKYSAPQYLLIAAGLTKLAHQLELPDAERDYMYREENLEEMISNIFPDNFNKELQYKLLWVLVNKLYDNLDPNNELLVNLLQRKKGYEAVDFLLSESKILSKDDVISLAHAGTDSILNSSDPFIYFVLNTQNELAKMKEENAKLDEKDELNNQLLGEALYAVYGDAIPPDATSSLRIADGIVKGYDYNGTRAPVRTTFYGSLDRYYSFGKQFPFNLPDYWENLPEEFDLSTTLDFVSTNDIIGGNSGSPVINMNAKIVGVAFDGNIESLPGRYIYTTEANRTVSVSTVGIMEALRNIYRAKRVSNEILNGGITKN